MEKRKNVVITRVWNKGLNIKTPPLGVGYLLKSIKQLSHVESNFIDAHLEELNIAETVGRIISFQPFMIGFLVFSVDYPKLKQIVPLLKSSLPKATIVVGGPHVTALPDQTLNEIPGIDYVIRSEAEEALPLLIDACMDNKTDLINIEKIPNLAYRNNGTIVHNQQRLVDVTDWREPAWDSLKPDRYPPIQHGTFHKGKKVVPIITSRGCPYPCSYCAGSLMTGKKIRTRHIEDVVDEIEYLIDKYGFDEIIIEDENFTFFKDRVINFANEIKRRKINVHISFPNGIRLDKIDEEIAKSLQSINVYMVGLGIESGSERTLSKMRKNWNLEDINKTILLLKKYGITVRGFFILGFSDETIEDINRTIDFAVKSDLDQAYFGNYLPLPGTEDFNNLVYNGELELENIKWEHYNSYFGKFPYHPRYVSQEILKKLIKKATLKFYLRPKILFGFLKGAANTTFIKSMFNRFWFVFKESYS